MCQVILSNIKGKKKYVWMNDDVIWNTHKGNSCVSMCVCICVYGLILDPRYLTTKMGFLCFLLFYSIIHFPKESVHKKSELLEYVLDLLHYSSWTTSPQIKISIQSYWMHHTSITSLSNSRHCFMFYLSLKAPNTAQEIWRWEEGGKEVVVMIEIEMKSGQKEWINFLKD